MQTTFIEKLRRSWVHAPELHTACTSRPDENKHYMTTTTGLTTRTTTWPEHGLLPPRTRPPQRAPGRPAKCACASVCA